ncbi:MAG: hypothetical protein QM626_13405 [Microbacterium sp.]|uniref:hypothetical protein n=1 Tax=Microbacterium sp. TaxID=51671 RepID=UPI0039E550BE
MRLTGFLIAATLAISPVVVTAEEAGCGSSGIWGSDCTIENTGTEVDIGATMSDAGTSGDSGGSGGSGDSGAAEMLEPVVCTSELCRGNYSAVRIPDVTMADLASFRPASPSISSEPAGIGLVGMPTNLVTAAETRTVSGELFGYAVTVRFTPAAYVFDHGDGTSRRATTGGTTWAALGQADFTPTATSYAYSSRGTYTVVASVEYTAQVDFGGGWRAVPGILTLASSGYDVRIVEARTALVARTCLENPTGPGC